MSYFRIKTINPQNDVVNFGPDKFKTRAEAESHLKEHLPSDMIPIMLKQGLIEIIEESDILDKNGEPLRWSSISNG